MERAIVFRYRFGMEIKIRFNTDKDRHDGTLPPWRVLIEGVEHLAQDVSIQTSSWTTFDEIEPGRWKWHITCDGRAIWNEGKCRII